MDPNRPVDNSNQTPRKGSKSAEKGVHPWTPTRTSVTQLHLLPTQLAANVHAHARKTPRKLLPPSLRSVAIEYPPRPNPIYHDPMTTRARRPGTNRAGMQQRAHWQHLINTTPITCRRCHQPIHPGQRWDLGHPPDRPYATGNHTQDLKPEHATCNKSGLVIQEQPTFAW